MKRGLLQTLHHDERGQTAIALVLISLGVFAVTALALDAGFWYFDHRTAQNQVDAASLAAVQELPAATVTTSSDAFIAAKDWLEKNGYDVDAYPPTIALVSDSPNADDDCSGMNVGDSEARIIFGKTASSGDYDMVMVCIRRGSLIVLSGLTAISDIRVSASGMAVVKQTPLTYALMAMNPDGCTGTGDGLGSLTSRGNALVNLLDEGGTYTRSPCDGAFFIEGENTIVDAGGTHDVVGACAPSSRCLSSQVNPDPSNNYAELLTDPFAEYMQPRPGACRTDFGFTGTVSTTAVQVPSGTTLPSGTYCQPLTIQASDTVTLGGGTHIFRQGLMVSGGSPRLLSSGNVLLYFTCATDDECGGSQAPLSMASYGCSAAATFCLQGNSCGTTCFSVDLNGPTAQPKAVIWIDRTAGPASAVNNRAMVRLAGQGQMRIIGNIYSITSTVFFEGQSSGQNIDLTGTIIADKINFGGQATYNVTWDADLAPRVTELFLAE